MTKKKAQTKEKDSDSELKFEKKLDIKEDMWDDRPTLTESEMMQLELNSQHLTLVNLEIKLAQRESENLKLASQLNQQKSLLRDKDAADLRQKFNDKKAKCKEFSEGLKAKYEIEGDWGFNPMTGEISQTTKQEK